MSVFSRLWTKFAGQQKEDEDINFSLIINRSFDLIYHKIQNTFPNIKQQPKASAFVDAEINPALFFVLLKMLGQGDSILTLLGWLNSSSRISIENGIEFSFSELL